MMSSMALPPTLQLFRAVDTSRGQQQQHASDGRPSFLETHCDVAAIDCTFESGSGAAFMADSVPIADVVSHIVDKLPHTVVILVLRVESSPSAAALLSGQQGTRTSNFSERAPNRVLSVVLPPTSSAGSGSAMLRHSVDSNQLICGLQPSPVVRAIGAAVEGCNTPLRSFLQVASFVIGRFRLRMAPSTFAEMLLNASRTNDAQTLAVLSSISTTHVEAQLETAVQSNSVLSQILGREHLLEYSHYLDVDVAASSAECGVQLSFSGGAAKSKPLPPCNVDVVVVLDCHSNFLAECMRRAVLSALTDYDRVAIFSAGSVVQVPAFCKDISKLDLVSSSRQEQLQPHIRTGAIHNSILNSLAAAQHITKEWCSSAESRGSRRQGVLLLITDGSEDAGASSASAHVRQNRRRQWEQASMAFGCSGHVLCLGRAQVRDMLPLAEASYGTVVDIPPSAGRAVPERDVPMVANAAGIIVGKLVESQRNCVASAAAVLVRANQSKKQPHTQVDEAGQPLLRAKLGTVAEFHSQSSCEIARTCSVVSSLGPVTAACSPRWFGSARKSEQLPRDFDPECSWDVFVAYRAHSSGPAFLSYRQVTEAQWQQMMALQQHDNNNLGSNTNNNNRLTQLASWAASWNRLNDALFGAGKATAAPILQQWDTGALRRAFEALSVATVRRLDAYRGFLRENHQVVTDPSGGTTSSSHLWASPQSLFERAVMVARSQLVGSVFADVGHEYLAAGGALISPSRNDAASSPASTQFSSPSLSPGSAERPSQQQQQQQQHPHLQTFSANNSLGGGGVVESVHRSPPRRPPTAPPTVTMPSSASKNSNTNSGSSNNDQYLNLMMTSPNIAVQRQTATPQKKVRVVTADELSSSMQQQQQQQTMMTSMAPMSSRNEQQRQQQAPVPPYSRTAREDNDDTGSGAFQARVTMIGNSGGGGGGGGSDEGPTAMGGGGGSNSSANGGRLNPGLANNNSDPGVRRTTRISGGDATGLSSSSVTLVANAAEEPPHSSALVDPRWLQLDTSRPKSATVEAALCRCLPAGRVVTDSSFAVSLSKFESGNVFLKLNPLPPLASYGNNSGGGSSGLVRRVFLFSVDSATGDLDVMQTAQVRDTDRAVCFEKVPRGSHCAAIFVIHEDRPRFKGGGWISMADFLVVDGIEFETPSFFAKSVDVWDVRQNQANFRWEGVAESFVVTLRALASVSSSPSTAAAQQQQQQQHVQSLDDGDAIVQTANSADQVDFCAPRTTVVSDGAMSTTIDALRPFTVYWVQVAPAMADITLGQRTRVEVANGIFCTAPSLSQHHISVNGCSIPASSATALIKLAAPRYSQVVNWTTSASGSRTTYSVSAEPVLTLGVNELKRDVHATAVERKQAGGAASSVTTVVASVVDPLDAPTWHFRSEVPMSTVLPLQVCYTVSIKQVTEGTASAATVKSWRTERLLQFPVGPFSFLRAVRVSTVRANSVTITWTSDPFAKFVAAVTRTKRRGVARRVRVVDEENGEEDSDIEDDFGDGEDEQHQQVEGPSAVLVKGTPLPGQSSADTCTFRATLPDLSADTGYTIRIAGHGCLNPEKLLVRTTPAPPVIDDVNPTHDYINQSVAVLLAPASRFEEIRAIGGELDDDDDDDDNNTAPNADTTDIRKLAKQQHNNKNGGRNDDDDADAARMMKHVEIVATILPLGAEVWSDDASAHVESTLPVNSKTSWALSVTREVVFQDPKALLAATGDGPAAPAAAPIRGRSLPEMPSLVSDPLELFVVLDVQVETLTLNRQMDVLFRSRRLAGSPITATLGSTTSDTMAVKRKELHMKKQQFQTNLFQQSIAGGKQTVNNNNNDVVTSAHSSSAAALAGNDDTIRGDALHSLSLLSKRPKQQQRFKNRNEKLRAGERSAAAFSGSDGENNGNDDTDDARDDEDDDDFAPLHRASFALPRRQEGDAIGSLLRFSSLQLVPCSTRFFALLSAPDLTAEDVFTRVFEDRVEITVPASAPIWTQLTHDALYQCSGVAPTVTQNKANSKNARGLPMFDRADIRPYVKWQLCCRTSTGTKRFPLQLPVRKGDPLISSASSSSSLLKQRQKQRHGQEDNTDDPQQQQQHQQKGEEEGDAAHNEAAALGVFHAPTFTVSLKPQRSSSNVEDLYLQITLEPVVDNLLAATQSLHCVNGGAVPRGKNPLHVRCPVVYDIRSLQLESCRPVLRGGGAASTLGGSSRVNVRPTVSDDNGKCLVRWHSAAPEFEVSVRDVSSAQVLQTVRTSAKNAELPVYPGRAVIISVSGPACGGHEVSMVVHFPGKHAPPIPALTSSSASAMNANNNNNNSTKQQTTPRNTLSVEPDAGAIMSTSVRGGLSEPAGGGGDQDEEKEDVIRPFFEQPHLNAANQHSAHPGAGSAWMKSASSHQQQQERENIAVVDSSNIHRLLEPPPGTIQLISTSPDFRSARVSVPATAMKKLRVLASTWPHGAGTVEVCTKHLIRRSDAPTNDLITSTDVQKYDEVTGEPLPNEVEIPLWADVGEKMGTSNPVRLPHFLRFSVSVCRFTPDRPNATPVTFPAVEGLPERVDVVLAPKIDTVDPKWLAVSWAGSADLYDVVGWIVSENETPSMLDASESAAAFSSASFGAAEVIRCQREVPRVSLSVSQLQGKLLMLRIRSVITHNGIRVASGGLCSNTLAVSVLVPLPAPLLLNPIIRAGLFACKLPRPHLLRDSGGTVHASYSINDGRGHSVSSDSGTRIGTTDFYSCHLRLPIVSAPATRDATIGTCLPCTVSLVRTLSLAPAHEPLRVFRCLNDGVQTAHSVALPELHGLENLRVVSIAAAAFDLAWTSTASTFDVSVTALIGSEAHLQRKGNTFFGGTTRHVRVSEPKFTVADSMAASIYLIEVRSLQCGDAVLRGSLVTQPAFATGTALIRRDRSGARCSLDIECNSEPLRFCLDEMTTQDLSALDAAEKQQSWTVIFEDTIELKRLSGAIETLSLDAGECIGVGKHRKPCYTFNIPISSAVTEIYWKKSARIVLNAKSAATSKKASAKKTGSKNEKENGADDDDDVGDEQLQQDDPNSINNLLASLATPLRQDEDLNTSAALAMEQDLLRQTRGGSVSEQHDNAQQQQRQQQQQQQQYGGGAGNSSRRIAFAKPEQYRILHRIGVSTLCLCSVPFVPRLDGFTLGEELHAQRATIKWACTAPTSAVSGFSVQATALCTLPFRELSQATLAPRALRSARGAGFGGGGHGNHTYSGADVAHYGVHSTAHGPNSSVLLGAVQTRVMSVDGGGDRQVNLVGLHPGALHEVIVRAEMHGGNSVSIVPKYSNQYPDVLHVEDESSGCPEGTCYFLTPPIRPIALPYRRYTGCVEAIFDGKRLAGAKHGLLGYIAVRAVPDNLVFVAAPPGESAQQTETMPRSKLPLKSETTTFVVAKGCDTVNDQLAVVQWHVHEPADSATHLLEHYGVIEAVEGHTPPHIWRALLNRCAWSEPEEQPVRLLRAVSRPLITTAGSDRLDVAWVASHGDLRFDVTYTNLTPSMSSRNNNNNNDDLLLGQGDVAASHAVSPAITPILSNFDTAQHQQFPSDVQPHQQQQHVVRVAQSCATLEHLDQSSLYVVDVCASHDDVPCQPTSFVALTAPKRRKPPRIHCVGLTATFELPKSSFEGVLIPHRVAASAGAIGDSQVPSALTLGGMGGSSEVTRSVTALVFTLPEDPAVGLGPLRDCRTGAEYLALADSRNTFRSHPDAAQRVEVQLRAGRSYMFCFFWSVHNPNAINTVAHSKVVVVEHRADVMAPSSLHVITRTRTSITVGWVPPDRSSPGQQFEVECSINMHGTGGAGGVMLATESSANKARNNINNNNNINRPGSPGGVRRNTTTGQKSSGGPDDGPKVFTAIVGGPLPDGSLPAVLKTHHTFIGLDEKHTYNFRVRSISQHGAASPWCAVPLIAVPVLMPPKPVDNIDVLSVTDTCITLSWTDSRNTVATAAANGMASNDVQSADITYTVAFRSEINVAASGKRGADGGDGGASAAAKRGNTRPSSKPPLPAAGNNLATSAQQAKEERLLRKAMAMAHMGEIVTAHRYIEMTDLRPNTKYIIAVTPKNHLGEVCTAGNANVTVRTASAPEMMGLGAGAAAAAATMSSASGSAAAFF